MPGPLAWVGDTVEAEIQTLSLATGNSKCALACEGLRSVGREQPALAVVGLPRSHGRVGQDDETMEMWVGLKAVILC